MSPPRSILHLDDNTHNLLRVRMTVTADGSSHSDTPQHRRHLAYLNFVPTLPWVQLTTSTKKGRPVSTTTTVLPFLHDAF